MEESNETSSEDEIDMINLEAKKHVIFILSIIAFISHQFEKNIQIKILNL